MKLELIKKIMPEKRLLYHPSKTKYKKKDKAETEKVIYYNQISQQATSLK